MAYAALLSVANAMEEFLTRDQDYSFLCGKDEMISLHRNIIWLQEFLQLIPMKFCSMTNQLENRVTDVAYQVEDIIEGITMGLPFTGRERLLCYTFCRCIQEISSISQEAKEMQEVLFKQNKATSVGDYQTTNPLVVAPGSSDTKVGLDGNVKQILDRVTSYEKTLRIIPIVGMGGIGKTTLARTVFENTLMQRHFDVRAWITVSQQYDRKDILRGLLQKISNGLQTEDDAESLIECVHKSLYNRRFLIVLDDMWDAEAWDAVRRAIPDNKNGSRVILTTRLSEVAAEVDSSCSPHQMQLLHEGDSWDLLRGKVFGPESCPPVFELIGKKIAKNCKGLPLAIVVVAGLLKSNLTKVYWEEVASDVNKAASSTEELDGILSLSYYNLPPELKYCFLYLGVFPEDFRISTRNLILFWVAEGFIRHRAPKSQEAIAEEYLEDLVERNLVLVMENKSDGKIRTCSVHDVLRELSIRKAKEEKFMQRFTGKYIDRTTFQDISLQRRSSITTYTFCSFPFDPCNTSIRSFLCIDCGLHVVLPLICSRFRLLKVLYGVLITKESMLSHLFELTNLRLLHFTYANCSPLVVPKSIANLQKLETLFIMPSGFLFDKFILPAELWKIPKLRHIFLSKDCTLEFPVCIRGYPVLENLQTLSGPIDLEFTKSVIRRTPNLKKLRIRCTHCLSPNSVAECGLNNLVDLGQLEKLRLEFLCGAYSNFLPPDFVFPHNLKKLSLSGSSISSEHMSAVGLLPNLEVLKLKNVSVEGNEWEPAEGEFLRLKYLKMSSVTLEYWLAESTHFPCLEKLIIVRTFMLEEIPLSIGSIDTLEKLIVKRCHSNVNESAERIREEQERYLNDALQVVTLCLEGIYNLRMIEILPYIHICSGPVKQLTVDRDDKAVYISSNTGNRGKMEPRSYSGL